MLRARMRLGFVPVVLLLPALVWAGQASPTTFEEAKTEAGAHDKLLLLDFFTDT